MKTKPRSLVGRYASQNGDRRIVFCRFVDTRLANKFGLIEVGVEYLQDLNLMRWRLLIISLDKLSEKIAGEFVSAALIRLHRSGPT